MHDMADSYEMQYLSVPPYEVLSTRWLPYEKVLCLKEVEEMVEVYYNSGQFTHSMRLLERVFPDAFSLYQALAKFSRREGYLAQAQARTARYQALLAFMMSVMSKDKECLCRETLTYDFYLREHVKNRPDFASGEETRTVYKEKLRDFYRKEETERQRLSAYAGYDSRQMSKMTHAEIFRYPVWCEDLTPDTEPCTEPVLLVFDYRVRDALTHEARTVFV